MSHKQNQEKTQAAEHTSFKEGNKKSEWRRSDRGGREVKSQSDGSDQGVFPDVLGQHSYTLMQTHRRCFKLRRQRRCWAVTSDFNSASLSCFSIRFIYLLTLVSSSSCLSANCVCFSALLLFIHLLIVWYKSLFHSAICFSLFLPSHSLIELRVTDLLISAVYNNNNNIFIVIIM